MPKQMESEKKICPYAATQTLESASFDQSGVNNASKPFAAPGSVSEMPTIIKNITKSSGIKNDEARATPFCTPKAIMAAVKTHTPAKGDFADKIQTQGFRHLQEVLKEKTLRIRTPGGVDRIIGIACRPTDNHCVIDADDDIGHHVPPADRLEPASEAAESQGRRTPVTVADGIIEQQQRDARRQKRDQIGQDERAAAVFKSNIGETPNIAQADGGPDGGNHKRAARAECGAFFRFGIRHVDTS